MHRLEWNNEWIWDIMMPLTWEEKILRIRVVRLLVGADDEPDAGQPVRAQRERHDQQRQDHQAVLRVPES